MPHPLEIQYSLSADELLDALDKRFRAKVTLEGAVAEVQLGKRIAALVQQGHITNYEEHDLDGYPDFTIWLPSRNSPYRLECKNVRDAEEAYRHAGVDVAYKVETQKTRTSRGDPSSRFYDIVHFDILAVCLGKKTGNWKDFAFIRSVDLARHREYAHKLAVMHRVPLPGVEDIHPWFRKLADLLQALK